MKTLIALGLAGTSILAAPEPDSSNLVKTPGASEAAGAPGAAATAETGAIVGVVSWEGERPEPLPPLVIGEKESEGCHPGGSVDTTDRTLLITDKGGVANVALTVEVDGMELEVPDEPIVLDQEHCRFTDRVVVVPAGATLSYNNSDEVNHNIHTYSRKNNAINSNVAGGSSYETELTKDETFKVACDIHPWMAAWVVVTEDPVYAVSGEDGSFRLEGLPPGTYTVSWWHEKLGKGSSEEVEVTAGGETRLELGVGESEDDGGGRRRRRR